jgi:DNA-binding SARP family transcriptional activator
MSLRIRFFGQFQVWRDNTLIPLAEWKMEKNKDLFKILASQPGRLFTKDQLIDLLWPDADLQKASATLRKRVSELRYILEPTLSRGSASQYILTRREGYALNPNAEYESDTEEFRSLTDSARELEKESRYAEAIEAYEKAVSLYCGDYLEDNPYEEWAIAMRGIWEDRYVDTLSDLAECHARLGHYRRAIAYCSKILQRKKFRENTYRQLMLYCYAAGFQGEAISAYTKCRQTMAELGVKLAAETEKLYQQIRESSVPGIDKTYPPPQIFRQPIPYSLGKIPFVGRNREYSKLIQWFNELSSGSGRVIMISGEAGVGKTRLIREILARYTKKYVVLQGRSQELSIPLAFHPLISALREGIASTALPITKLEKVPPVWLAELTQLVPELHGMFPKLERNPALPANQTRLRQLESWSQLLLTLIHGGPLSDQPRRPATGGVPRPVGR